MAPADKAAAREALVANPLDPDRTIVRINPVGTEAFDLDLAALRQTRYRFVMLAKTEELPGALDDYSVVALCETARGVLEAPAIAAATQCRRADVGFGGSHGILGGTASRFRDGHFRAVALHARSAVLLAAAAYGKSAIDTVFLDIENAAGLAAGARDAVASGFAATACIHPSQVEVVREAYAPSAEEIALRPRRPRGGRADPRRLHLRGPHGRRAGAAPRPEGAGRAPR